MDRNVGALLHAVAIARRAIMDATDAGIRSRGGPNSSRMWLTSRRPSPVATLASCSRSVERYADSRSPLDATATSRGSIGPYVSAILAWRLTTVVAQISNADTARLISPSSTVVVTSRRLRDRCNTNAFASTVLDSPLEL